MKKKIEKKLLSKTGETLAETLVGLLIVVLALNLLAGSIVSAAKINSKIDNQKTSFQMTDAQEAAEEIQVCFEGLSEKSVVSKNVNIYQVQLFDHKGQALGEDEKDRYYYYYEYKTEE